MTYLMQLHVVDSSDILSGKNRKMRPCLVQARILAILLLLDCGTMAQSVTGDSTQLCSRVTSNYIRPPAGPNIGMPMIKTLKTKRASDQPTQVHISLNGPNYMHVSWITKSSGNPSVIDYGTVSGEYSETASGKASSYSYLLYKSGDIHDVVIGPLEDATTYYYRLGGGGDEFSFKTPPGQGPEVPITFSVVGDLGQTSWTKTTLEHIKSKDYDLMLYSGDLSYADYYQPLWDSFGELVSPLTSMRPWMVTQGNHEQEYLPLFVESFRAYNARWSMPFKESGSSSNLFYSFEVAGCHILMLGSYADYSSISDQYKWIQADLSKVDRSKTPWLIVVLHAPWYNSNTAHQGDGDGMMKSIEPLLLAAKVDILFAGHVHAYERSTRVYNGVPNSQGVIHINIGDGGNREGLASKGGTQLYSPPFYFRSCPLYGGPLDKSSVWPNCQLYNCGSKFGGNSYISPQPVWSLFREASFGYGQLKIQNCTTARWSWHRNDDNVDVIADKVDIISLSYPNSSDSVTSETTSSA